MSRVLALGGDGVGPEVTAAALEVVKAVAPELEIEEGLVGGASIDANDEPLTADTLERAKSADAVLLGAVGGPKWEARPLGARPEAALLGLRKELALFANLRPVRVSAALAPDSPLKPEVVTGTDLLVVRELIGGLYFGEPRGADDERGFNTFVYSRPEIERIARVAFDAAKVRRGHVTSVDKANVLEVSGLWRKVVSELAEGEGDIELEHALVDSAAMRLVRAPTTFDVVLTGNLFGDILSDIAAVLPGSLGMLPSASLGEGKGGLYEPVHGSAPDIAGTGAANPLAAIASAAMMLRHSLDMPEAAKAIDAAIDSALAAGLRTRDLGGNAGTAEATKAVLASISRPHRE